MIPEARYVGSTELPWEEGNHDGPTIYNDDLSPVGRKASWTLTGLSGSHKFFTHQLLLAAGTTPDPVEVYWAENNLPANESCYILQTSRPVFGGLPDPYSRIVFACPDVHAPGLFKYLDRLAVCSAGRPMFDSLRQNIYIVDWPMVDSMSVVPQKPPVVVAAVWGVEWADSMVYFKQSSDLWTKPFTLVKRTKPPIKQPK